MQYRNNIKLSTHEETRCQFSGSKAGIKLGIDVHQDFYVVMVQEGGSNPKPAQRFQKRSVPALRGKTGRPKSFLTARPLNKRRTKSPISAKPVTLAFLSSTSYYVLLNVTTSKNARRLSENQEGQTNLRLKLLRDFAPHLAL